MSHLWQTVFWDPAAQPAIFDFVQQTNRDESLAEIGSRAAALSSFARHRNALVLVKWLTETLPEIALLPTTSAEASHVGNLALVTNLHQYRPHEGCTWEALAITRRKKHWDVLEYLLRNHREFYTIDLVGIAIRCGEEKLFEALQRMGLLAEMLRGHEKVLIKELWYDHGFAMRMTHLRYNRSPSIVLCAGTS